MCSFIEMGGGEAELFTVEMSGETLLLIVGGYQSCLHMQKCFHVCKEKETKF